MQGDARTSAAEQEQGTHCLLARCSLAREQRERSASMAPHLRIAVSYAYVERPNTRRNLQFFLRHGLDESVALLSIVVKGGPPRDGAGAGGVGGFTVDIPEEHRARVRVTFAEENVGYDMESHRRNARLFAEEEAGAGAAASFTHIVAMNDSALGPFCRPPSRRYEDGEEEGEGEHQQSDEHAAAAADDDNIPDGPGPGPWHRLFAERLTRLRSHPPSMFVGTIRHLSYFLFFAAEGWTSFAAELEAGGVGGGEEGGGLHLCTLVPSLCPLSAL